MSPACSPTRIKAPETEPSPFLMMCETTATWSNNLSEAGDRCGKGDGDFFGRGDPAGTTLLLSRTKRISGRRVQRRIHQLIHGVLYVVGGERRPVREADAPPQRERIVRPSLDTVHPSASSGSST